MRWAWLFLAACAVGAIVTFLPRDAAAPFTGTLPVLATAPTWTLRDLEGREVRAVDFAGKVVVLDFWATWCEPCVREIPGYVALQKKYADQGLVVLGVSVDTAGAAVVRRFATDHLMNYTLLMADDAIVKAYGGVSAIPTTFLLDHKGRVRHRKVGTTDPSEYESLVVSLLKEKAAADVAATPPAVTAPKP